MRFEDLISADGKPPNARPALRTMISTDTTQVVMSSDLRNAGFVSSITDAKRSRRLKASRRNFIRGSIAAAGATVAATMTRIGPAREAQAQGTLVTDTGFLIWTACPSYAANHECVGCGPTPVCTLECCDAQGFFREDPANGLKILRGQCSFTGGLADGWLWAHGAPCAGCRTVEFRCTDGLVKVEDTNGLVYWLPYTCRAITQCGGVPIASTSTPIPVAPTPTATPPPGGGGGFTLTGQILSAVNNGDGTLSVTGWIAQTNSEQTSYVLTLDGDQVATAPADLAYNTGLVGIGPNHGFSTLVGSVPPGTYELCLSGYVGAALTLLTCLTVTVTDVGTPPTSTTIPLAPTPTPVPAPPSPTPIPNQIKNQGAVPLHFPASGVLEVIRRDTNGNVFVSGWGAHHNVSGPLDVVVTRDDLDIAQGTTGAARSDVTAYNPQFANAVGFALTASLLPGVTSDICVYLQDPGTGARLQVGCRSFTG